MTHTWAVCVLNTGARVGNKQRQNQPGFYSPSHAPTAVYPQGASFSNLNKCPLNMVPGRAWLCRSLNGSTLKNFKFFVIHTQKIKLPGCWNSNNLSVLAQGGDIAEWLKAKSLELDQGFSPSSHEAMLNDQQDAKPLWVSVLSSVKGE